MIRVLENADDTRYDVYSKANKRWDKYSGRLYNFQVFFDDGTIVYWDYKEHEKKRKLGHKGNKLFFVDGREKYVLGIDIPYDDIVFYGEDYRETHKRMRFESLKELEQYISDWIARQKQL